MDAYLELANAAVELWADDYRRALRLYRKTRDPEKARDIYNMCKLLRTGLLSNWGNTLSRGLSTYIVERLEESQHIVCCKNCKFYDPSQHDGDVGTCCIYYRPTTRADFCRVGEKEGIR